MKIYRVHATYGKTGLYIADHDVAEDNIEQYKAGLTSSLRAKGWNGAITFEVYDEGWETKEDGWFQGMVCIKGRFCVKTRVHPGGKRDDKK